MPARPEYMVKEVSWPADKCPWRTSAEPYAAMATAEACKLQVHEMKIINEKTKKWTVETLLKSRRAKQRKKRRFTSVVTENPC
jgi:hypothetical protein